MTEVSTSEVAARQGGHLAGERFGKKQLAAHAGRNRFGHHLWMWVCLVCDTEYGPSTISHMRRASACRDCSLLGSNNPRWRGHEQIGGVFLGYYQLMARKRGLAWEVTPEQLWAQWLSQEGKCAYTRWDLEHGVNASLDRIDNTKGYHPDNVQWVHRDVNRLKSDLTEDYFMLICRAVAHSEN